MKGLPRFWLLSIVGLVVGCLGTLTRADSLPVYLQQVSGPSVALNNVALLELYAARYQQAVFHPWQSIPADRILKPGMQGEDIQLLRARLAATADLPEGADSNSALYDQALASAVAYYQTRMGLKADGIAGPDTLRELNVPAAERLQQIMVNLKRWNNLTPHLGKAFIMVNVPDYRLYVYENGHKLFDMKAIVGKPTRKTPEITSRVTRLVFNPSWNVPSLIARKDIVPKIIENPDYLNDMHIHVLASQEPDAPEISADDIDWESIADRSDSNTDSDFPWFFRQDPGNDNALGRIKFEFQNADNIYLHDTPAKLLFAEQKRTFSSGCVRLERPFALVDYLMKPDPEWSDERMQTLLDNKKTAWVRAPRSVPIFITYLTAWVDENGALNFRDDVYNEDKPGLPATLSVSTTEQGGKSAS